MADLALKHDGRGEMMAEEQTARAVTISPRIDLLESEDEFLLLADMPGVKSEDVDIRFEKGELTIHGRRHEAYPGKEAAFREYDGANFSRAFLVAETVAADRITAELKNGVLTVRLPKTEAVKPKKITVKG
jgi:HSP20 family protein